MIERLIIQLINRSDQYQIAAKYLRSGLYTFIIVHLVMHFQFWEEFYGLETIQHLYHGTDTWWSDGLNMVTKGIVPYWAMLCLVAIGVILDFTNSNKHINAFLVFVGTANLFRMELAYSTAGHHLLLLLLFWNLFYSGKTKNRSDWSKFLTGLGVVGAQVQICLLYLVTGWIKVGGEMWRDGSAFAVVSQIDEFSHPVLWSSTIGGVSQVLTWVGLAYQLIFPILIWFRPIRTYLLAVGVGFHLTIALLMGLWEFSAIMCIAYLVFYLPGSSIVDRVRSRLVGSR